MKTIILVLLTNINMGLPDVETAVFSVSTGKTCEDVLNLQRALVTKVQERPFEYDKYMCVDITDWEGDR